LRHQILDAPDAYLEKWEPDFPALNAAIAKDWYMPLVGTSLLAANGPGLDTPIRIGHLFSARAMLRAQSGDFQGFSQDITSARLLARRLATPSSLQFRLSAIGLDRSAIKSVALVVGSGMCNQAQLADLKKAIANLPPMPPLFDAFNTEHRWAKLETIQDYSRRKNTDLPYGLTAIRQNLVNYDDVLKLWNKRCDAIMEGYKIEDYWTSREKIGNAFFIIHAMFEEWTSRNHDSVPFIEGEPVENYSARAARAIVASFEETLPYQRVRTTEAQFHMNQAMLNLLFEAAEMKASTGTWPADLSRLKSPVPADIFLKNNNVTYVTGKSGARIYSVGRNAKDDGGHFDRASKQDDDILGPDD
jgi:hypothetical protein